MHEFEKILKATMPAPGTNNTLTVALNDYDIPDEVCKAAVPVIVGKTSSAGVGKVIDEKVVITDDDLVLTEGATGFVADDIYWIKFAIGSVIPCTGAVSTV
jgi:hypothetical protein